MLYSGGNKMNSNKSVVLSNIVVPTRLAFFPSKSKERNAWGFTRNCHPEFISGSTPLVIIQNKEEMLKQVQHDNRRGFTLIELLIVVLIIGILAAVAVPQYQKAVAKTRLTLFLSEISDLKSAFKMYHLETGTYPTYIYDLDIWDSVSSNFLTYSFRGRNYGTYSKKGSYVGTEVFLGGGYGNLYCTLEFYPLGYGWNCRAYTKRAQEFLESDGWEFKRDMGDGSIEYWMKAPYNPRPDILAGRPWQ